MHLINFSFFLSFFFFFGVFFFFFFAVTAKDYPISPTSAPLEKNRVAKTKTKTTKLKQTFSIPLKKKAQKNARIFGVTE